MYSEYRLKFIIIEELHGPIHQSIRGYWSNNAEAELQDLVRKAKSMANLRGDHQTAAVEDKAQRGRKGNLVMKIQSEPSSTSVSFLTVSERF